MTRPAPLEPERWERLMALFDELVALRPGERDQRLAELVATDYDLVVALERLLVADAGAGQALLESPAGFHEAPTEPQRLPEPMPERAGSYRLVGLLGRGGMADVYAGERDDGDFTLRVAVKVLRRGLDTRDLLGRFLRERRILARLEHPAIARLLDGGELADGRPYLAMERVDGLPMHRHAEERGLGVEQRVALLRTACEAVAFAHRSLVVHRDIKPSNVLVTERGEVKLLDFGIAKLLAAEEDGVARTATVQRLLTPAYAAPEQRAGGVITTATDVWGLGALAYELLVGEPPYEAEPTISADPLAPLERPPTKPSARVLALRGASPEGRRWAARLAGDLDVIVQKALALDPERRYASVQALADDLDRHLAGRPVRARPDSFAYSAGKFVRRHRAAVATTAAAVLAVVGGAAVALWQAGEARRERAVAERERDRNASLVEYMLGELSDQIEPSHRLEVITSMGGQVLASLDAIPAAERTPATAIQRARVLIRLARAAQWAGDSDLAEARFREAIAIFDPLAALPGAGGWRAARERAEVRTELARTLEDRGDRAGSLALAQKSITEARELVAREPHDGEHRAALALALHQAGRAQLANGDTREALASQREAATLLAALPAELLESRQGRLALLNAHLYAGRASEFGGDTQGAAEQYRAAIEHAESYSAAHSADLLARHQLSVVTNDLGRMLRRAGHYAEAAEVFGRALEINREVVERDPENHFFRSDLGACHSFRGRVRELTGDLAGALDDFRADAAIHDEIAALEPANDSWRDYLADGLTNEGRALMGLGRLDEALAVHERALALRADLLAAAPADVVAQADAAWSHLELGRVRARRGEQGTAEGEWRRATELLERVVVTSDLTHHRVFYARALLELGERERARPVVERLLAEGAREPELLELARRHGLTA